jgi:cysteinyl-tRNA synthetase
MRSSGPEPRDRDQRALRRLGLSLHSREDHVDASADLVTRRDAARGRKDWAEADRLRNELVTLGWVVEDWRDGELSSTSLEIFVGAQRLSK